MRDADRIGKRVSELRKIRGFSQRELAKRAHVSYSLITKVESGHAPASPAFIGAVARALRVDVPRITGQPYEEVGRGRSARLHTTVDPLRRALTMWDLPSEDARARPYEELAADVRRISDLGRDANYVAIGETLPTLLDELSVAVHSASDDDRPRLYALAAEAYSGVSSIANLLGYLDLRDRVIDRIEQASHRCDDPLRVYRVRWQRTSAMMAATTYQAALALMDRTRKDLGTDPARMPLPVLSLYGSMHLRSAIISARAAKTEGSEWAGRAWTHLEAAREAATIMRTDRDDYGLSFGPSNVTQHEVSVAVELEEGTEAVKRARATRLSPTVPTVRRGHHYIDLARAHLLHGDHPGTMRALQQARRIAPQQTRHHPMVRETVLAVAHTGRGSEDLTRFAVWLGLDR